MMRVRAETSLGLGKRIYPYCFPCGAPLPNTGHDSFVVVTIKLDDVVPSYGRELSLKLHVNLLLIQLHCISKHSLLAQSVLLWISR